MGLSVIAGVSVARLDAAGVVDAPRDTSTSQPGDEYLAEVPEILVLRGLIADGVREVQALLQAQRRTEARCRLQKKKVLELRLHELLRKEGRRRREEACSLSRASNLSSGSSGGSFAGDDACSDSSAATRVSGTATATRAPTGASTVLPTGRAATGRLRLQRSFWRLAS
ncbi:hypothetical protein DIPPA_28391 [Diplonema papillatum]|nr:hypothetical protein DIPPA_28391 [Diplonema papillatum]